MKLNKDRIFSICVVVFSLFMIYEATQLKSIYAVSPRDIGPKLFPIFACAGMILCAVGKFVTSGPEKESKPLFSSAGWKNIIVMFLAFIGYLLSLYFLGFLISTPIFIALFVYFMRSGKRLKPVSLAVFALAATGILYFTFQDLIFITLPTGIIF